AGPCDVAEACTGNESGCPADHFRAANDVCRPAAGDCDLAESCSGDAATCPADQKKTRECRPAAGPCDVAERCAGKSDSCPADALRPAGTVCRPAADQCDAAETCNGSSASCPPDQHAPVVCGDGKVCGTEQCDPPGATCPGAGVCSDQCTCAS